MAKLFTKGALHFHLMEVLRSYISITTLLPKQTFSSPLYDLKEIQFTINANDKYPYGETIF